MTIFQRAAQIGAAIARTDLDAAERMARNEMRRRRGNRRLVIRMTLRKIGEDAVMARKRTLTCGSCGDTQDAPPPTLNETHICAECGAEILIDGKETNGSVLGWRTVELPKVNGDMGPV